MHDDFIDLSCAVDRRIVVALPEFERRIEHKLLDNGLVAEVYRTAVKHKVAYEVHAGIGSHKSLDLNT